MQARASPSRSRSSLAFRCIAGLSPGRFSPTPNVTVFPNTIGQAASFDVGLVARIGAATALEGRIVNQVNYAATSGQTWQGVLCDGGPLANTAHGACARGAGGLRAASHAPAARNMRPPPCAAALQTRVGVALARLTASACS